MQLKPIGEQVVVVFGASSGIGRLSAIGFARKGAKVVVAARSESGLVSLVDEICSSGGEAIWIVADAADYAQVEATANLAVQQYGRIDTWVQAAATAIIGRFEDTSPEEFERVIQVSLMGQVYAARVALPHLKRQGGAFISISSVEGRRSLPLQSAYSAAKHGVEGFLESLRVELMHDRVPVSVTSILPAVINTPFYDKARTKLGVKPTGIPPYYEPDLVADAVLYAAENPVREMTVGDVGKLLDLLQRLSPSLVDSLLAAFGVEFQRTQLPKSEYDPNNLYAPVGPQEGYDRSRGDFSNLAVPSFFEWLDRLPPLVKPTLGFAALGAAALLVGQTLADRDERD